MNKRENIVRKKAKEYKKKMKQEPFDIIVIREKIQEMQMSQKNTDTYPKEEMLDIHAKNECLGEELHMHPKMFIFDLEGGDDYTRK
jgi:hypothetical protein